MKAFKRGKAVLVLAVLTFLMSLWVAPLAAAPDNQGSEFILGFLENYYAGSGGNTTIFLTGPSATTATVAATGIGFGPMTVAITPGTITSVSIPTSIRATGSGTKQSKGILITSPKEVTVYGLNQVSATTDAFLGLPTDILGKEYLVGSFRNRSSGLVSELMVVGTVDGTQVTMKPTATTAGGTHVPSTPAGTPVTFSLNRLQAIQFMASGSTGPDLTGTEILATQPVAVFGGHVCADVPGLGTPWCDHLVEQIPPLSTWGDSFLTVPLATRTAGDLFRIVAANNGTTVSIDGTPVANINRGQFYEVSIPSNAYRQITTSGPALVLQYSKGSSADGVTSDPFMMMIPPTGQFASDYTVSTPPASPVAFNNFINIAAPTAELAGLRLDGAPITAPFTPIWTSGFSGAKVPVSIGAHTVKHISPIVPFGVYVYGFASYDSYGYPGGLRLAPIAQPCTPTPTVPADGLDNDCDGKIDEELGNGVDDDGDGAVDEDLATPPANAPPTANANGPYPVPEGGSVALSGSGSDPDGDPLTYAWDLDNNGSFETPGQNPTFSAAGRDGPSSQTVVLKVCDNKGACATASATVNVTNVAPTITSVANSGPINEGSSATVTVTASDPAGANDPLSYEFDCNNDGSYEVGPQTGNSASCAFGDNGSFQVNVRVSDGDGGVATGSTTVVVNNVPPTANAGPDQSQYWGLPVNFSGSVSDPSPADTAAGLNPTWTFGDGSPAASGLNVSHTYANPGAYIATLTATDKDGGVGSDTAQVTVNKRGSTLTYTGDTNSVFGFATFSAQFGDAVDPATAKSDGRVVTFSVAGNIVTATTNASGFVTAPAPPLLPGTHVVNVSFAEDSLYLASSAQGSLTVVNSVGKVTAGTLRSGNNGRGGFNVQSDGTTVKGELQFQNDSLNYHAPDMTALGISPDNKKAWFAGTGRNGQPFVAYVEDNGEPGRDDIFKLWVAGVPQNSDGKLTGGNVQIHK